MIRVDAAETRRRVAQARDHAGPRARLIGFEAVEIQRFVAASSRPITIQGASAAVKAFDGENADRPETIFAGGGRGLMLVAEGRVSTCVREIEADFRKRTAGLSLAVANVPYDRDKEGDSLRWLWLKQRAAHDACAPDAIELDAFAGATCADCRARPGVVSSPKPEAARDEKICTRCDALVKLGRATQDAAMERWTFEHMSEDGLMAVVSADGNSLGQCFRSLDNLAALRAGSQAVSEIFWTAHSAAIRRAGNPKHVAPVTGGDDIKVFLPPTAALEYVSALIDSVEQQARAAGDVGGLLAGNPEKMLGGLGVGVGLLIAPFHVPAPRLVDLAHDLEDAAKRGRTTRSAVCFALQRTDGAPDDAARERVAGAEWPELVRRARLLRDKVPRGQRAAAAAAWELEDAERDNQLLYQLARSKAWTEWFDACGVDWRDREAALRLLRTKSVLSLAGLGRKTP